MVHEPAGGAREDHLHHVQGDGRDQHGRLEPRARRVVAAGHPRCTRWRCSRTRARASRTRPRRSRSSRQKGHQMAYVGDVVGTGSSRKSATNSVLWYMGDDIPYVPNKRTRRSVHRRQDRADLLQHHGGLGRAADRDGRLRHGDGRRHRRLPVRGRRQAARHRARSSPPSSSRPRCSSTRCARAAASPDHRPRADDARARVARPARVGRVPLARRPDAAAEGVHARAEDGRHACGKAACCPASTASRR